jgi:CubicO group peptidase (beta-lactamase class C family)
MQFFHSFQSEWIKRRRSSAVWLTLFGGLFVPVIMLISRLVRYNATLMGNASDGIWQKIYNDCWQYMAFFLLPMGVTLAASLIAQIEYRNNTWKQVLTTPQTVSTVFWAKYVVVLLMLLQFFVLFNIGIVAVVTVPAMVYPKVPFPQESYPFWLFLKSNAKFFVACLPVLGLQYLLSLHIRNFIIPIVAGFGLTIAALIGVNWKYGYTIPYTYAPIQFLMGDKAAELNIYVWALGYFVVFTTLNYILFLNKQSNFIGRAFRNILPNRIKYGFFSLALLAGLGGIFLIFNRNTSVKAQQTGKDNAEMTQRIKAFEKGVGLVKFNLSDSSGTGIAARMQAYGVKGLSIAVIDNYEVEWAKGYGLADAERKLPVTSETLFIPGSISKALNAIGVMQLYEQGKIDLFKDVNDYLRSWKLPYNDKTEGKKITLAQLLSHSAGLNVHGFGFETYAPGDSLPTVVQILKGEKPAGNEPIRSIEAPGKKHRYSGGGTMVSQLVQMDVTGLDYATDMRQRVLEPLGMNHSFFNQPPPAQLVDRIATGYTMVHEGQPVRGRYPVLPQQAAAGLWTTAPDLANMVVHLQKALRGDAGTILSKTTAEMMLTPYNDESATPGFFIEDHNGYDYFHHAAGNPGFSGKLIGSMNGGKGLVICINSDGDPEFFEEIIKCIGALYGWEGFDKTPAPVLKNTITLDTSTLQRYVGAYRFDDRVAVIERRDNALFYKTMEKTMRMYFTDERSFFNIETPSEKTVGFGVDGRADSLVVVRSPKAKPQVAMRVEPIVLPEAQLQVYTGNYLEESEETATLVVKDGTLWIHSPNAIAPMPARFLTATDFYLEQNGGIFKFTTGANGKVTGVKSNNGVEILRKKS